MILVDTSVWVGHLRAHDQALASLLDVAAVLTHPFVIGEVALGSLRQREQVLKALGDLPHSSFATDREVFLFIERHALFARGIGYVDASLLTSTALTPNARLWTADRRLHTVAAQLGLATSPPFAAQNLG